MSAEGLSRGRIRYASGFSYTEVLVAMVLIAVLLIPATDALYSGVRGGDIHADEAEYHFRLVGKMEEVLARPFAELVQQADLAAGPATVVTAYSDPNGTDGRRLVYLARYDGDDADGDADPFTDGDEGLLWVRVAIEGTPRRLDTLTGQ